MNPAITILMPVYNGEKYLREAIDSILNQSFVDYELLIINDGSNDNSISVIESFKDSRIKLVHNEKNIGLAETCNRGLDLATGEYIARMDCDDVSLPDRLRKQFEFMESHPEIGICGTWAKVIGENQGYIIKKPTTSLETKTSLLFSTCFIHPTVMMRKEVINNSGIRYKKEFDPGDDYVFWVEISNFTKFANLPEVLLHYRMHPRNISKLKSDNQIKGAKQARLNMLLRLNIEPSERELFIHSSNSAIKEKDIKKFLNEKEVWLKKIISRNTEVPYFNQRTLERIVAKLWLENAIANASNGWPVLSRCLSSSLIQKLPIKQWPKIIKLAIKCQLKKNNINDKA